MVDPCNKIMPSTTFDFNPNCDCCHPMGFPRDIPLESFGDCNYKPLILGKKCPEKVCTIFGNHDAFPAESRCVSTLKISTSNSNSLGRVVGLIQSSYRMSTAELEMPILQPQRFATIMKTMAKLYIMPITKWTTQTLDTIMQEGQQLFTESKFDPVDDSMILPAYNDLENMIHREFQYESMTFHIELSRKFVLNGPFPIDDKDDTSSFGTPLKELFKTLRSFYLRDGTYGLLMLSDWYLMIWRQQEIYFVADYYGRRVCDFRTDREDGVAMLISFQNIENIIHLILNLSNVEKDSTFSLREMHLVTFTSPDGRTQTRDYVSRKNEYRIINDDYAYLKARLHLSLNPNEPLRNRSALPTAIAALIAAKIDIPGTWTGKQLDNLMCYGFSFCHCGWTPCLHNDDPVQVEDFPQKLKLGQFFVEFSLHPYIVSGVWHRIPDYKHNELSTAIEELFEAGHTKLIIQIEHQIYSVWLNKGFIYLFDPFRHRVHGDVDPENLNQKTASLRVFRLLDLFLNAFNLILGEMTRTTRFHIHSLQIVHIRVMGAQKKLEVTECSEVMEDVISLNEYICYEEDEIRCEELADISDYGDDDQEVPPELPSSKSSSTVGEEMEEEGEGGFGRNIAGIESSSSHEDITRKVKKRRGSKHGSEKSTIRKGRIPKELLENNVDFDGGETRDIRKKKKSKLRNREKSDGDQSDDSDKPAIRKGRIPKDLRQNNVDFDEGETRDIRKKKKSKLRNRKKSDDDQSGDSEKPAIRKGRIPKDLRENNVDFDGGETRNIRKKKKSKLWNREKFDGDQSDDSEKPAIRKGRIPKDLRENNLDFDGGETRDIRKKKKSKLRNREKSDGDRSGDSEKPAIRKGRIPKDLRENNVDFDGGETRDMRKKKKSKLWNSEKSDGDQSDDSEIPAIIKERIPKDLRENNVDFDGGETRDIRKKKKSNLRNNEKFNGNAVPGAVDDPRGESSKNRSSKTRTAADKDDKRETTTLEDEQGRDGERKQIIYDDKKRSIEQGKAGGGESMQRKNSRSKLEEGELKRDKQVEEEKVKDGEKEKTNQGEEVKNEKEKNKQGDESKIKDGDQGKAEQDKERRSSNSKEKGSVPTKDSRKQQRFGEFKRNFFNDDDLRDTDDSGNLGKSRPSTTDVSGTDQEDDREKLIEAKNKVKVIDEIKQTEQDKERRISKSKEKGSVPTKYIGKQQRIDEIKRKFFNNAVTADSEDIGKGETFNTDVSKTYEDKNREMLIEAATKLRDIDFENVPVYKDKDVRKKKNRLKIESKMKVDEEESTKTPSTDREKETDSKKLDKKIMDGTLETPYRPRNRKRGAPSKEKHIDVPIREEPEELIREKKHNDIAAEKRKTEKERKEEMLLIEKERREIEDMRKQLEQTNKQRKKDIDVDPFKTKRIIGENTSEKSDRYSGEREYFQSSFGEQLIQKPNIINDGGLPSHFDDTEVKIKPEPPSKGRKYRKGKKGKGRREKSTKVEQEIPIICKFKPLSFSIDDINRICQRETVDDVCRNVLSKLECKKTESKVNIDGETLRRSTSRDDRYPGFNECPTDLVTIQLNSTSRKTFLRLFRAAFQCTDRVLVVTTWNNTVVFRYCDGIGKAYYVYNGCTCNINRFRHMDLRCGTAGLIRLSTLHEAIDLIISYRKPRENWKQAREEKLQEILSEYASR